MTKLNVHEAKTHLSRYLARVRRGETILICLHGKPVAQLTPIPRSRKGKRLLGIGRGLGKVTKSFFEPLTDKDFPGVGLP